MFFYFSKLLSFFLSPLIWILLILGIGVAVKRPQLRRRLFITGLLTLLLFTNPFIIGQLTRAWGNTIANQLPERRYDAIIVLSGFLSYDREGNRINFGGAVDRMTEALALYKKGQSEKLIISGGSGSMLQDMREASIVKDFLVRNCGVPESDIMTDTASRNTYENAVESRKLLRDNHLNSALVITTAMHMRRTMGCFRKVGVDTDFYAVDVPPVQTYYPDDLIIPDTNNLLAWETLLHEVVGVIIYKIKGYN